MIKRKQETDSNEFKRQDTLACLTTEDELSLLVLVREQHEAAQ